MVQDGAGLGFEIADQILITHQMIIQRQEVAGAAPGIHARPIKAGGTFQILKPCHGAVRLIGLHDAANAAITGMAKHENNLGPGKQAMNEGKFERIERHLIQIHPARQAGARVGFHGRQINPVKFFQLLWVKSGQGLKQVLTLKIRCRLDPGQQGPLLNALNIRVGLEDLFQQGRSRPGKAQKKCGWRFCFGARWCPALGPFFCQAIRRPFDLQPIGFRVQTRKGGGINLVGAQGQLISLAEIPQPVLDGGPFTEKDGPYF